MKKITIHSLILLICICFLSGCKPSLGTGEGFTDKEATSTSYGYKTINSDDDLTKELDEENTIYCIEYEFNLEDKTLTIPEGCVVYFGEEGKITNGNVIFNQTYLDGAVKFSDVYFGGTLANQSCKLSWFGLNTTVEEENEAITERRNASVLTQVLDCVGPELVIDGFYPISEMVTLSKSVSFVGADWSNDYCTSTYEYTYEPKYGFFTNGEETRLFTLEKTCNLNVYGVYFKGYPEIFINATSTKDLPFTWAFILPTYGSLGSIYNCKIEGFMQGIRGVGGYLEKIQNTTFNACQVGLFTTWTSDFDVFGCKFTNCMPNVEISEDTITLSAEKTSFTPADFNNLRHIGCGIWSCCCGMVNYANNYYENNFIDFLTNEADIIINITDSKFVNATFCNLYFFNDYNRQTTPWMSLVPSELHKYAIDNFVVTGNTFARTKNSVGKCVVLVRETDLTYLGDSSGTPEKHSNRGMNVIFSGNTFDEKRESVPADEAIFAVSNETDTTGTIVCSENHFDLSSANYFANLLPTGSGNFVFVNNDNVWGTTLTENKTQGNASGVIVFK